MPSYVVNKERTHSNVDAAALNPTLHPSIKESYFKRCHSLRERIKEKLTTTLVLDHDVYLVSNASAGVLAVAAGLALDGKALRVKGECYPKYRPLKRSDKRQDKKPSIHFLTHVDPLSGEKADLSKLEPPFVLDASQSFGTTCWHAEAMTAGIVVSGLHKHVGIAAGLGIVAIRKDLNEVGVRDAAHIAEDGTMACSVLEAANRRLQANDSHLVNCITLNSTKSLRAKLSANGIKILTPDKANLPFVCFQGPIQRDVISRALEAGLTVKYFRCENIVRISGYCPGSRMSSPRDYSDLLHQLFSG